MKRTASGALARQWLGLTIQRPWRRLLQLVEQNHNVTPTVLQPLAQLLPYLLLILFYSRRNYVVPPTGAK